MIEVKGLIKDFGSIRAVDNVSFEVPKCQILGFLGPNGAGKSTTMKMLTCFLKPTAGTAFIGGHDIESDSIAVRELVGYLPESSPLYSEMTVQEFLAFIAEMRGLKKPLKAAERMKDICALRGVWHQSIETLSKGYRQRVGFAQALIHDPPVLILDEPTDGLDPNQKHEVRELIRHMGKDKTIILSTHILEEVEAVCDRALIIAQGKLVADASPQKLMEKSDLFNAVTIRLKNRCSESLKSVLGALADIARVESLADGDMLRFYPVGGKSIIAGLSSCLHEQRIDVEEIHVERGRFDEVFRKITLDGLNLEA